jgi:hypothetical protein
MQNVVEAVAYALSDGLGDQLAGIFLYGSLAQERHQPGESDANLLIVVADGASIHALRSIFRPVWEKHGEQLRRAPLVAQQSSFVRHMKLYPVLARHLANEAKLLIGDPTLLEGLPAADPREPFAQLAHEVMEASAAVAPEMLEPDVAEACLARLRSVARRVSGVPVPDGKSAIQMLAEIHQYLQEEMDQSPHVERWVSTKRPSTSLLLPSLEGAYKELGQLVMSFSTLTAGQITSTDWQTLSSQLAKHYTGLKIATSTQFRLIVELETPLAYSFERYEHEWGVDILSTVEAPKELIMRNAARLPSEIQIDSLPNAYLTQDDDMLGKLIHDFQNRMLNIQLEHELLRRLQQIEPFDPPEPLPDRTAPPELRIDAIFNHLNEWADFYTAQMSDLV